MQRFVHEDGTSHYFTLRDEPRWHPTLMRLCAFDVVANNADRKSGHVLLAEDRLWAIDNGLCFNRHDKLRTVIWDFGGAPLDAAVEEDLARLAHDGPPAALCELSSRRRWPPPSTGWPGSSACGPCPSWSTTASGRRTPGRWSEPAGACSSVRRPVSTHLSDTNADATSTWLIIDSAIGSMLCLMARRSRPT